MKLSSNPEVTGLSWIGEFSFQLSMKKVRDGGVVVVSYTEFSYREIKLHFLHIWIVTKISTTTWLILGLKQLQS